MASIGIALWRARAMAAAPEAPYWLTTAVAAFLADERADSDAMLLLADALEDAARAAGAFGEAASARALHQLADVPRRWAPLRAAPDGSA